MRYFSISLLIGVLAGVVAAMFHLALDEVIDSREEILDALGGGWEAILVSVCLSAGMALLAAALVRYVARDTAGSGIPEVESAVEGAREMKWFRTLWVKFTGGLLALGSGLVLGREGPTIHLSAAVAQGVAEQFDLSDRDRRGLLAAGAAAGLAAAFNAPLAAVMFVSEEMRRHFPFKPHTYIGVINAAVIAAIIAKSLAGVDPVLEMTVSEMPISMLPFAVLGGAVMGFVGLAFNRSLMGALSIVDRLPPRFWWAPAALFGGASGLLLVVFPDAAGGGERLVLEVVSVTMGVAALITLCVLRFAGSIFSYTTGVPGGIFAPLLAIAATLGLAIGSLAGDFMPVPDLELACAVVAMGALFAACVHAPVVAVVLALELTGAYHLSLPLIVACASASVVVQLLNGQPIYELLLERSQRRSEEEEAG